MKNTLIRGKANKYTESPVGGRMEAIARGVRVRFEQITGYYDALNRETVRIARALEIPEKEIEKWSNRLFEQAHRDDEKLSGIKSRLSGTTANSR
jgi:hypothetical protein